MENFNDITMLLADLSKKACDIMLKYYSPNGNKFDTKSDLSPVTKADIEINQMVIDNIKKSYPEFEVLAEEVSTDITKSNKLFVVDPLDGTHMFTIGAPLFCFSAAVVIDGECTGGVIANPLAKRTLLAEKGKGTYLIETNSKINVSTRNTLKRAVINTGWMDSAVSKLLHAKNAFTPEVYSVCEAGSLVALGGFDGIIFSGKSAHDIAAIKIIVEEAGGKVTNILGDNQLYNESILGAIVSNGNLHEELIRIVKESGISTRIN